MYCPQCGTTIPGGEANFCPQCGFNLKSIPKDKGSDLFNIIETSLKQGKKVTPDHEPSEDGLAEPPLGTAPQLGDVDHVALLESRKPQNKWGKGWILLVILVGGSVEKVYSEYDENTLLFAFAALAIALPTYFGLRNQLLRKIPNLFARSATAGFVAWIASGLVAVVQPFVPLPLQNILLQSIQRENSYVENGTKVSQEKLKSIWATLVLHPRNIDEAETNLQILDGCKPLVSSMDTLIRGSMKRKHEAIATALAKSPRLQHQWGISVSDLQANAKRTQDVCDARERQLITLAKYNQALIAGSNDAGALWEEYTILVEREESAVKDVVQLSNNLTARGAGAQQ